MSDRFQELHVFVRAAETGSFSATARELGLSQPSVSRIVSELEARLGTTLLLRSTRNIVRRRQAKRSCLEPASCCANSKRPTTKRGMSAA
jgi:DNA-binding transcriptional LysR family regulator